MVRDPNPDDEHLTQPLRPRADKLGMSAALQAIEHFNQNFLLPLFSEIAKSPALAAKRREVLVVEQHDRLDSSHGAALMLMHRQHYRRRHISELATTPLDQRAGEWFGHSLVIMEPRELCARFDHPLAGRYYSTALFRIAPIGRVYVSPWVFYWMRYDDRLHSFDHRYDDQLPYFPIENITRAEPLNHVLNSLTYFDLHAFSPMNPFGRQQPSHP